MRSLIVPDLPASFNKPRAFLLTEAREKSYISCNPKFPEGASGREVEDSCEGEIHGPKKS